MVAIFGSIDILQEAGLVGSEVSKVRYSEHSSDLIFHLLKDVIVTFLSILTSIYLIAKLSKSNLTNKIQEKNLHESAKKIEVLSKDLIQWKASSEKWRKGLISEIESQMQIWGLSPAEREIAFFLIKGFSYKEIGEIRKTSESTIRAQAQKIYEKSKLNSRAELSAFFLEDLF